MTHHIVLWNFKDDTLEEKKTEMKNTLEALVGKIDGLVSLKVSLKPLPSSNADVLLTSTFATPQALAEYIIHPEHQKAGKLVKEICTNRVCFDYQSQI